MVEGKYGDFEENIGISSFFFLNGIHGKRGE